jgi:signal transduction histidine kinase
VDGFQSPRLRFPAASRISVADTGVGIAPEDCAAVFEGFARWANSRPKPRTGLGLALARKFVELHGGKIGVTSEVGKARPYVFTMDCAAGDSPAM